MINRQSHTFSSNLGIIVHVIVKIVLGFTCTILTIAIIIPKLDLNVSDYLY